MPDWYERFEKVCVERWPQLSAVQVNVNWSVGSVCVATATGEEEEE